MKRILLPLVLVAVLVSGCQFQDSVGRFFGSETPPGEPTPAEQAAEGVGGILGLLGLGTGGAVAAAALRIGARSLRVKNALFDSVETAIKTGNLSNAKTEAALKKALHEAQQAHDDSRLIADAYQRWKLKKKKQV